METTLAFLPPGEYNPDFYQPRIREIDWQLIGYVARTGDRDLVRAASDLKVPVSSLINSNNYLKALGVL